MTLYHILDCFPQSTQEACIEAGVQYHQVPMDGKHYAARLINDPSGCLLGGIVRSPNGDCGFVYNRKLNKSIFYIIREAIQTTKKPFTIKKNKPPLTSQQIYGKEQLKVLKAIIDNVVQA